MALRDIIAKFGFDFDKGQLDNLNKGVEGAKSNMGGLVKAVAGVFALHKLKELINDVAGSAANLGKLAQQTGQSIEQVEFFLFAMPVPAEEAEQALRKFTIAMGRSEDGAGAQAESFKKLGVSLKDSAGNAREGGDVLEDVVTNWSKLHSAGEKASVAVDLFGRAGVRLIPFLSKGKEGLAALHQEFEDLGGGFGAEAVENAMKYKKALKNLNTAVESLEGALLGSIFEPLADFVKLIAKGVGWFKKFSEHTNLAKASLITLGTAGVIGIGMLLAPFAGVIAAITAVTLGLDDLIAFMNGGRSLFGDALNNVFGEGTEEKVKDWCTNIGKQVQDFFVDLLKHPRKFIDDVKAMFKDFAKFDILGDQAFDDKDKVKAARKAAGAPEEGYGVKDLWNYVTNQSKQSTDQAMTDQATGQNKVATDWFASLSDKLFGGTPATPGMAPVPGQAVSKTVQQTNHVAITVTDSTPADVKDAVEQGATNALGNERRAAQLSLEQSGG